MTPIEWMMVLALGLLFPCCVALCVIAVLLHRIKGLLRPPKMTFEYVGGPTLPYPQAVISTSA